MGIRIVKTQLFAALSFALLAGCSTDSGVISKKDGNQQISSSPNSPIQRLADEHSESKDQIQQAGDQRASHSDTDVNQPAALARPGNKNTEIEISDLQAKTIEPPISAGSEELEPVEREIASLAADQLATAQQEAERLKREAAELAAAQQEADRLKREAEAAELAAAQQEADRLEA